MAKSEQRSTARADDDKLTLSFNFEGRRLTFKMPNENATPINTASVREYDSRAERLASAVRKVRQQPLFGNVNVEELTKGYPFIPFRYQIANVEAMLNRFEGRGVFGDQVGLGKTVEALITAHVMFAAGAIRYALIVTPSKTFEGWEREINSKFGEIFEIRNVKEDSVATVLSKIVALDKEKGRGGKYPLFIITDEKLKSGLKTIQERKGMAETAARYNRQMDDVEREAVKSLLSKIKGGVYFGRSVTGELELEGYKGDSGLLADVTGFKFEKWQALISGLEAILEKCEKENRFRPDEGITESIESLGEAIGELRADISWHTEEISIDSDVLDRLEEIGADLLIVDEVHSFYENKDGKKISNYEEVLGTSVDRLAAIRKKYCVLVSATPVRTCLEDVFDLIYIADSARLGGSDKDEKRKYFYSTLCQLSASEAEAPYRLSVMVDSPEKRKSFFGVINNFFTRRRISEVSDDMKGSADTPFSQLSDEGKALIFSLRERIIERRTLTFVQSGTPSAEDARERASEHFDKWVSGELRELEASSKRHIRDAVDSVLIEVASDVDEQVAVRRLAHSLADWRRRKKRGVAIIPPADNGTSLTAQKIKDDVLAVMNGIRPIRKSIQEKLGRRENSAAGDVIRENFIGVNADDPEGEYREALANIENSLANDTVVCYLSRKEVDGVNVRKILREAVKESQRKVSTENNGESAKITLNNYNNFFIVGQGHQAGVNLQQYRTLLFTQMDWRGQRLLEPVDIEQWVGRIYRTGQVKRARVITVLRTYVDAKKQMSTELLKWYYTVLSDSKGLDLYGEDTPDVAFLQPIIVDALRKRYGREKDSFSDLMKIAFARGEAERGEVVKIIRTLCGMDGFGKAVVAREEIKSKDNTVAKKRR